MKRADLEVIGVSQHSICARLARTQAQSSLEEVDCLTVAPLLAVGVAQVDYDGLPS